MRKWEFQHVLFWFAGLVPRTASNRPICAAKIWCVSVFWFYGFFLALANIIQPPFWPWVWSNFNRTGWHSWQDFPSEQNWFIPFAETCFGALWTKSKKKRFPFPSHNSPSFGKSNTLQKDSKNSKDILSLRLKYKLLNSLHSFQGGAHPIPKKHPGRCAISGLGREVPDCAKDLFFNDCN